MSANYSPWETSNFAGSSLEGTMAVDRASGPSIADVMEQPPPPEEPPQQASPFADQLSLLGQFGQQMAQSQQPPEAAIQNITFNAKTGMAKLEMPQSALAEVMGQLTDLKTMKAAAMAQVAKYRQQEASGSPILDALSQFAGGMAANDPTMPGWVQALGRTSLSMGNQGIEKKRMLEEQRVLQYGEASAGLAQQLMQARAQQQKQQEIDSDRDASRAIAQQNADTAKANAASTDAARKATIIDRDIKPITDVAKTTGIWNDGVAKTIDAIGAANGMSPKEIEAEKKKAETIADSSAKRIRQKQDFDSAQLVARTRANAEMLVGLAGIREGMAQRRTIFAGEIGAASTLIKDRRLDDSDEAKIKGLNDVSKIITRLDEGLKDDPTWQGPAMGWIAKKTFWTSGQQRLVTDVAKATLATMEQKGLSFAKTSDRENLLLAASMPSERMTPEIMAKAIASMEAQMQYNAKFLASSKYCANPDLLIGRLPERWQAEAAAAYNETVSKLSPVEKLARDFALGNTDGITERAVQIGGAIAPVGQNAGKPPAAPAAKPPAAKGAAPKAGAGPQEGDLVEPSPGVFMRIVGGKPVPYVRGK